MRSLGAAVMLSGVALMGILLLFFNGMETTSSALGTATWTGRSLLALAPIREKKNGPSNSHRHGHVEYRYQNVDCDETTIPTVPTTTTTVRTTTITVPTTTTVPATTVPTTSTITTVTATEVSTTTVTESTGTSTSTSTATTTVSPCVTCPPTTDLCFPWVCIRDDQEEFRCVQVPVECNDGNDCTSDRCVAGACVYTLEPQRPGCNCTSKDCESTPCDPKICVFSNSTGPECISLPVVCDDGDNCTDNFCIITPEDGFNCTYVRNDTIVGCLIVPPPGLDGGQIAGIVIGAVAAAAIAALIAFWARKRPPTASGVSGAGTTPAAQTSPLYNEPVNAGVMPV